MRWWTPTSRSSEPAGPSTPCSRATRPVRCRSATAEAYLVIEDTGRHPRATGHTGCNQFGGPVEVGPGELTFGDIVTTKMACAGGADALERAVLAVLTAPTVTYEIEADRLTLRAPDGTGLQLRPAAE